MSRRTKTSAADAVVEIIAMLPWWGGVAMALVFYLVLGAYATSHCRQRCSQDRSDR